MWGYVIIMPYWWLCYVGLCNHYVILVFYIIVGSWTKIVPLIYLLSRGVGRRL